eukprot:SAG22_NODE_10185_length_548_cov_3.118040_2_plen_136_part_01
MRARRDAFLDDWRLREAGDDGITVETTKDRLRPNTKRPSPPDALPHAAGGAFAFPAVTDDAAKQLVKRIASGYNMTTHEQKDNLMGKVWTFVTDQKAGLNDIAMDSSERRVLLLGMRALLSAAAAAAAAAVLSIQP